VQVPVEDMTAIGEATPGEDDDDGAPRLASIWPAVEERVLDLIQAHRSTIVFTNSRRGAERLCARINELAAARQGAEPQQTKDQTQPGPRKLGPGAVLPAASTPAEM